MSDKSAQEAFMRRAIALAENRVGRTGANPAVGCIIVKDGLVIGEAATAEGGRPHAEQQALEQAGDRARGAVVYVTLEPCAERSSGEKSCAVRLLEAGVAKVFVACADASHKASGRGTALLREGGIVIAQGLLEADAEGLYATYAPDVGPPPERRN